MLRLAIPVLVEQVLVLGAWCAMVTDVTVRAALIVSRFGHGGWKRVEV